MNLNVKYATITAEDNYTGGNPVEVKFWLVKTEYISTNEVAVADSVLDGIERWVNAQRGR